MMRAFELRPYVRWTVGFDRMLDLLETMSADAEASHPLYDIEKTGDDTYRIVLAVPGYAPKALTITAGGGQLVVAGKYEESDLARYLHRGIVAGDFEGQFRLARLRGGHRGTAGERPAHDRSEARGI